MRRLGASAVALRTAAERWPAGADAGVAIALAALVVWEITSTDVSGPLATLVALGLATTLPLAVRRRLPLIALGAVVAGILVLDRLSVVQEPQTTLLPFVLVVYSVAAHAEDRVAVLGLVAALVGILVDEADDFVVMGPLTTATWLAGRLVRSWRRQATELARLAEQLERERAQNSRLAVIGERTRIARELHDVVGHTLSLMVLQAGAERLALGAERPDTRDALVQIESTGRSTLTELRRLVGVLRSDDDAAERGPAPGLARLGDLVESVRQAGLTVDLEVLGEPRSLPSGLDVSAFRIVQEALTNTVRHASASAVRVCVDHGPGELRIEVTDDGRTTSPRTANGGHGLVGMRERVALYGGRLTVGPRTDGGFAVCARLPLGGPE
jgi:signal transduction histidine kinase